MGPRQARAWHAATAVVATAALLLQLVLVLRGGRVLDDATVVPTGTRLLRLVAYFTIQSNLLVAVGAGLLAVEPGRDGRVFRPVRLAGLLGITVTALVHFFLLRPLQDLDGLDLLADTLLHVVVPLLAVAGWLLAGPRPRWDLGTLALATAWPIAWLCVTLVVGAATGWYPYPFLDVGAEGWGSVLVASLGVTALFGALAALVRLVDVRGGPLPRRDEPRRE